METSRKVKDMIIIPGFLISLITFPGVIVHEAAHMFFCKLRRVAVFDMCFFRVGNPSGYIIHEEVEDFTSAFLICVGPLLINSLLCVLICFPAFMPIRIFDIDHPLSYLLMWLGISIGMHAFPSTHDATNLFNQAKKAAKNLNPLAIASFPLVGLIVVVNVLSIVWADFFYGVALGFGLPELVFKSL
jgi:hypothetical protein